jgi:hypothetical protein
MAGRKRSSHGRYVGHLEPIHHTVRSKLRRHSKSPEGTKPTGQANNEVARSRPVHYGLRKTNTRSKLPNRVPRKHPNVPERTPRRRSRRRVGTTPRPRLPLHKRKGSSKREHEEDAQSPPRFKKRHPRTIGRLAKVRKRQATPKQPREPPKPA